MVKSWLLSAIATLPLLLTSAPALAECVDAYGCICRLNDVLVVASIQQVKEDGYMTVQIERIEEVTDGASEHWQVGQVLDALPFVHVEPGARAYLTAIGRGATDMLVQFNQAQPGQQVVCSDVSFDEEDFIATALASDCQQQAEAQGLEAPRCNDDVHCTAATPGRPRAPSAWWLVALTATAVMLRRRSFQ